MADANRCPDCGAELPPGVPAGPCDRCSPDLVRAFEPPDGAGSTVPAREGPEAPSDLPRTAPVEADATGSWAGDINRPTVTAAGEGVAAGLPGGEVVRYFGNYEIRRELGRGGMGVVYEARQVSLNRAVALKMVKAGLLAGDDELRRFQNEAEAVALLDHPGVVPIYEVGEHDGQRYFSMRLVGGGSLVPLLERYKADPKAAAGLMVETAEAVAHAHARGILHRDLKPANILVDEQGHPHVTDFGLAKRVEADVELTASGAILGTPAYMAPEQATGRRGSITTATDVYGLGSVLYALLTGRAPFGSDSVVETLDAVRSRPPEPPTRLNAKLPRDLETICLKCLEKDPRRRYPTAQALADDLNAWLERRPIAARRVGAAERAWLWCKRRPAVAALAAGVLLAATAGTAAVIVVQAAANRRLAAKNADLAAANERVEQRFELATDAIKSFHTGVSEDFLLEQDQFKNLRDRLLKSASDFYGKLSAQLGAETDLGSRRALTESNFELADLTVKVGRAEDALAAHRAVLAAREGLVGEPGAGVAEEVELGRSLTAVAMLLETTGKSQEALATFRRSESLLEGLPSADPSVKAALAICRSRLGTFFMNAGKADEALAAYDLARTDQQELAAATGASDQDRSNLAATECNMGALLIRTGRLPEAEKVFRLAREAYMKLVDENPTVADHRHSLAQVQQNLAFLLSMTGRVTEAETEHRRAIESRRSLVEENPAVAEFRSRLAEARMNLGNLYFASGRPAEADAVYRLVVADYERLVADNPGVGEYRERIARITLNKGMMALISGRLPDAEADLRQAVEICERLADEKADSAEDRLVLAVCHSSLGSVTFLRDRAVEAETEHRRAVALLEKMAADQPTVPEYRDRLATDWTNLGQILRRLGRSAEAQEVCDRAVDLREALVREVPDTPKYRGYLAFSLRRRGEARRDLGDVAGAAADLRRALSLWDGLSTYTNEEWFESACAHAALAALAGQTNSGVAAEEAASEADRSIGQLQEAVAAGFRSPELFRVNDCLDPLRGRDDFRRLMLELAFPADPFAQ